MTTCTYRFGRFSPADAQALAGKTVAITTHADVESGDPADRFGPSTIEFFPERPDRMFVVPVGAAFFDEATVVRLVDVAEVVEVSDG